MSLAGDFGYTAEGNISPCRFVKGGAADGGVVQADAGALCLGISQEGTHNVPYSTLNDGYAAVDNEPVKVFKLGEVCLLEIGGAVTRYTRLKSDANGKGVTAAAGDAAYALALKSGGADGVKIPVMVIFDQVNT